MPVSSRSVKKANYLMLIEELKCAGFTAYRTEALEDLRVGLLKKNGAVDRMIVDKSSSFKKGTKYPFDVDIQIIYHSYMPKSQ